MEDSRQENELNNLDNASDTTMVDSEKSEDSLTKTKLDPKLLRDQERKARKKDHLQAKEEAKQIVMTKVLGFNDDKTIDKRQKTIKNIFVVLFIVLVVGVLAYSFYKDFFASSGSERQYIPFPELMVILLNNWYYLVFALLALGFCYLFKGFKLSLLCKYLTGKWHFKTCIETAILGHYYNYVTPLAVGGQPFEIYHLAKHGVKGGVAASLPISTYFLNQLAFVGLVIASMIIFKNNSIATAYAPVSTEGAKEISDFMSMFNGKVFFEVLAYIGLGLCLVVPTLVVLFSLLPKFCAKIVKIVMTIGARLRLVKDPTGMTYKTMRSVVQNANSIKKIAKNPLVFILSFLLSLGESLALSSIAYFILRFFGFDMKNVAGFTEWCVTIVLCEILYIAISFIPTPGNSGAADLSFYLLFSSGALMPRGTAFPAMVTWRVLSFYSFIIIGFIFVRISKRADRKRAFSLNNKLDESDVKDLDEELEK